MLDSAHARRWAPFALAAPSAGLAACGDDDRAAGRPDEATQQPAPSADERSGAPAFEHIHGLGAAEGTVDVATQADDLYVGPADSSVKRSSDGGASWTVRAAP